MSQDKTSESIAVDWLAEYILRFSLRTAIEESNWRALGFSHRPKRGTWFTWLANKQQLAWETFVLRELFVFPFSALIRILAREFETEVVSCASSLAIGNQPNELARGFSFETRDQFVDYVVAGASEYLTLGENYFGTFLRRQRNFAWNGHSVAKTLVGGALLIDEGAIRRACPDLLERIQKCKDVESSSAPVSPTLHSQFTAILEQMVTA